MGKTLRNGLVGLVTAGLVSCLPMNAGAEIHKYSCQKNAPIENIPFYADMKRKAADGTFKEIEGNTDYERNYINLQGKFEQNQDQLLLIFSKKYLNELKEKMKKLPLDEAYLNINDKSTSLYIIYPINREFIDISQQVNILLSHDSSKVVDLIPPKGYTGFKLEDEELKKELFDLASKLKKETNQPYEVTQIPNFILNNQEPSELKKGLTNMKGMYFYLKSSEEQKKLPLFLAGKIGFGDEENKKGEYKFLIEYYDKEPFLKQ